MFQHLPAKEDVFLIGKRYKDVNRLRNGYIKQVLTNVDNNGIVKNMVKIFSVYEGVTYRENFMVSPLQMS